MFAQVKLMLAGKTEEFHQKLFSQDDLEFRVKTAVEALMDVLPLDVQCELKSSKLSHKLRLAADNLFFSDKRNLPSLLKALELYSKSVAVAENKSRELPLAYANRSAILFNLRKHAECVKDIDRALQLNYPDSLRANLLRRKAKCLTLLGEPGADNACEEARRWLQNVNLTDNKKEKLKQKIEIAMDFRELPESGESRKKVPFPIIERHAKIPCASTAVDIKYSKEYGRHIVANRDIAAGEVLAIEKPYALLLKPDCIYTHCSHCFRRAWDAIPCPHCIHAMYCSEKCRNEAWGQYHDIECPIKPYLQSLTMNDLAPFSLKLAVLAVREAGGIEKLRQQLQQIDDCKDCFMKSYSEEGVYRSDIYKPLYCLETHVAERWSLETVSMMMNVAVILNFVFTLTPFFGENSNKGVEALADNKDAMFIGKLMAHHYSIIPMNDHELVEILPDGSSLSLGAVVFPFCSLFNHSCNPNATRIAAIGDNKEMCQLILAQQPIKKGSQIFDDYGFDFSMALKAQRNDYCQKYFFTCECEACKDNWPVFNELPSILSFKTLKDKTVEIKKIVRKVIKLEQPIMAAAFRTLDAESEDILKELATSVTALCKLTPQPSQEFYRAILLLRQAFLLIHGNRIGIDE